MGEKQKVQMPTEMCKFAEHENVHDFYRQKERKKELNKYEKEIKKQLQVISMQRNILHYGMIALNLEYVVRNIFKEKNLIND